MGKVTGKSMRVQCIVEINFQYVMFSKETMRDFMLY